MATKIVVGVASCVGLGVASGVGVVFRCAFRYCVGAVCADLNQPAVIMQMFAPMGVALWFAFWFVCGCCLGLLIVRVWCCRWGLRSVLHLGQLLVLRLVLVFVPRGLGVGLLRLWCLFVQRLGWD